MSEAKEMDIVVREARETAEELIERATKEADRTRFMFFMPRSWKERKLYEARKYLAEAEKLISAIETREKSQDSDADAHRDSDEVDPANKNAMYSALVKRVFLTLVEGDQEAYYRLVRSVMRKGDPVAMDALVEVSVKFWNAELQAAKKTEDLEGLTSLFEFMNDIEEWDKPLGTAKAKEEPEEED